VLQCPGYADIRQSILYNICELNGNVINMSDDEKCLYVFHIIETFSIYLKHTRATLKKVTRD
jgi:hypothetical protein